MIFGPLLFAAVYPLLYTGADASKLQRVTPPGVRYRMNMAMATSAPWVDSNLWKYRRDPKASYIGDLKGKPLIGAMAEAFAAGVALALETTPDQAKEYHEVLAFLKQVPSGPMKPWVNFLVREDGSVQAGEVLNLMSRRNLLFRVDPKGDVVLTSKIANPYEFMQELREKAGDDRRLLRLFGSELTMAELAREGNKVRLHLLNYGNRPVEDLRIRIKGKFRQNGVRALVYQDAHPALKEFVHEDGFTEFTLGKLPSYAVFDLSE